MRKCNRSLSYASPTRAVGRWVVHYLLTGSTLISWSLATVTLMGADGGLGLRCRSEGCSRWENSDEADATANDRWWPPAHDPLSLGLNQCQQDQLCSRCRELAECSPPHQLSRKRGSFIQVSTPIRSATQVSKPLMEGLFVYGWISDNSQVDEMLVHSEAVGWNRAKN